MKKILITISIVTLSINSVYATTGFLSGEQTSGMNKICYYDVLGSTHTLNVASYEICPVTAEF